MFELNINIDNIFSSLEHNYFTRKKYDVGDSPTVEHQEVHLQENLGLPNDRFENSRYPITFFSFEVAKEVCDNVNIELDIKLFRRNIIISGVYLNALIGKRFFIDDVEFEGIAHCAPCTWMNESMKKGVYKEMIGRGGLRAKVIKSGTISKGNSKLISDFEINQNPLSRLTKPNLP